MKIGSLFTGCGGLDLGFEKEDFDVIWANEFDDSIWNTFIKNYPKVQLDKRDIRKIKSLEIPDVDGFIGGPPCQSWSEAGSLKGLDDERGTVFFEYVRILRDKQPLFFLAENVSGMLWSRHKDAFSKLISELEGAGYNVNFKLLNAKNFNVPQDRKRLIIVGYRKDLNKEFVFPKGNNEHPTLKNAIWDLKGKSKPAREKNKSNKEGDLFMSNHEHYTGEFSSRFMSRNRVRGWDEPAFTVQASGRHARIHPQANKMIKRDTDDWKFDPKSPKPYRRFSVRESARIQTFPDDFVFEYEKVNDGYKMVGNAVPVNMAKFLAKRIKKDLSS